MNIMKYGLYEDLTDIIYNIAPDLPPFFSVVQYGRLQLTKQHGASMRQRRRRMSKPVRFTPAQKTYTRKYEWHVETL